jgi:hypothetical protein
MNLLKFSGGKSIAHSNRWANRMKEATINQGFR